MTDVGPGYQPGVGATPEQESAYTQLRAALAEWGLEALADWAWDKIVNDQLSTAAALVEIRDTKEWQDRFGTAVNGLIERGLPAMSEAQILAYEKGYREVAYRYGLPTGFYSDPKMIQRLIANGQSFENSVKDIEQGFAKVARTSPETRAVFAEWFGREADAAIAAMFINPTVGKEELLKAAQAAELAGAGFRQIGLVDQNRAKQLVGSGVTISAATAGFQRIAQRSAAFAESISETEDLTATTTGVDNEFGIGDGGRELDKRLQRRSADVTGGGGASRGRGGLTGLG